MHRTDHTEVLVVGAGPVGMTSALCLAERGVHVKIVDQEPQAAAHSYACVLHPRALELFDKFALTDELFRAGRRLERVAFFDGEKRQAEVRFGECNARFPFALVIPQSSLESLLERTLRAHDRVSIEWNHRLRNLVFEGDHVVATVERLTETATGYSVPRMDWTVSRVSQLTASFVIGADGHDSHVRQVLGIGCVKAGAPMTFAVYEFDCDQVLGEARVILDERTTNVLWALPNGRCRWTFQIEADEAFEMSHSKERVDIRVVHEAIDRDTRDRLIQLIQQRAPWFIPCIGEVQWSARIRFEPRMSEHFGRGRCWLAGDAAHETSPIGAQSMNYGIREADELAACVTSIVRSNAPMDTIERFAAESEGEWRMLLGIGEQVEVSAQANPWTIARAQRIPACIPASNKTLSLALRQLGLEQPRTASARAAA